MMMFRPGMSCKKMMKVIQSYLDGEVDEKVARKVAKHLNACVDCDEESTVFKNIKKSLANKPEHISPEILSSLTEFTKNIASKA